MNVGALTPYSRLPNCAFSASKKREGAYLMLGGVGGQRGDPAPARFYSRWTGDVIMSIINAWKCRGTEEKGETKRHG